MKTKIIQKKGQAVPLRGNDIDTDRIIPARFMKCTSFDGLGKYAFYDARFNEDGSQKIHPFNNEQYKKGSILIVNQNFGCGSSREHAPQALAKYGIQAIIGESFAEIFCGNCLSLGIPAVTLKTNDIEIIMELVEKDPKQEIDINLEIKEINIGNNSFHLIIDKNHRTALLKGMWDSTSLLAEADAKIEKMNTKLPY